jgi:hypothetical protein
MVDQKSKIFFIFFFTAICLSIVYTYEKLEIERDFHIYTQNEELPNPEDWYNDIFNALANKF